MTFQEWLHHNTNLADSSIDKYARAVHTISREMISKGVIRKSLDELESLELEMAIAVILINPDFLAKDKRGNHMYSNALKHFRYYHTTSYETKQTVEEDLIKAVDDDKALSETSRKAIINARIGQGKFRADLIDKYKQCVITGVQHTSILVASHIKPWAVSNNQERLSVDNGFLLTPTYDRLFDIGLITFDEKSVMHISKFLGTDNEKLLHIKPNSQYNLKLNRQVISFLQYHNDVIFIK